MAVKRDRRVVEVAAPDGPRPDPPPPPPSRDDLIRRAARADLARRIEQRCGDILFGAVDDERFDMVTRAIREEAAK